MATTIITKNGSGAPADGDLSVGELAVDLTNKDLYSKDSLGNVFKIGNTSGGSAGTFTDLVATDSFTSPGIDDNATTTQLTIEDSGSTFNSDVAITRSHRYGTAFEIENTSTGGKAWELRSTGVDSLFGTGDLQFNIDNNSSLTLKADRSAEFSANIDVTGTATLPDANVTTLDVTGVSTLATVTADSAVAGTQTANATGPTTLDFSAQQNFVLTLTGNVTLANPTTETVGQSGFIVFIQDATGGHTVSLGTEYETAGAGGLTLSSSASTTDIVPYVVAASGRILLGAPQLAFA